MSRCLSYGDQLLRGAVQRKWLQLELKMYIELLLVINRYTLWQGEDIVYA